MNYKAVDDIINNFAKEQIKFVMIPTGTGYTQLDLQYEVDVQIFKDYIKANG